MTPFFRRIRRKLANDNQFLKYSRYAIGEILLVVAGILIALQINNWNENRKHNQIVNNIYAVIKSDLQADIKGIDEIISWMESRDTIFLSVINNKLSYEDYTNHYYFTGIISGYPDIILKTRGLKLLESNSSIIEIEKDSLSVEINNFYSYHNKEIEVALTEMSQDFHDNYLYWKNNKLWFNDLYNLRGKDEQNDDLIKYLLTDDYRTRVGSFYILHYTIYLVLIKEYRGEALKLIEHIDNRIEL